MKAYATAKQSSVCLCLKIVFTKSVYESSSVRAQRALKDKCLELLQRNQVMEDRMEERLG